MDLTELKEGQRIKVIQQFTDFDGDAIEVDSLWTFRSYSYFPYDGGYTFNFIEGTIRLAELSDANRDVLNGFSNYFVLWSA